MKQSALIQFRHKLAQGDSVLGLWVTLESPSITEMAVGLGMDWVVIDAEHGHLDWRDILGHLRATVRSNTVALVRIAENNRSLIKRVLDIGADGVVVPWIESVEELKRAVDAAHYPPGGLRGIGAERATCWGECFKEHIHESEEHVLVVPIIESPKGGKNIRDMVKVDGVDIFFFGPADYSSMSGYRGQWEGPGVAEEILAARDVICQAGKHCGIVATNGANFHQRQQEGFRMLGVGLDGGLLLRSLHDMLNEVGRDRSMTPGFVLENKPDTHHQGTHVCTPPPSFRPDRPEVMTPRGRGVTLSLERGVEFECLVGQHNHARELTTGIVSFEPGATLPYHQHTFVESVTVLQGSVVMEVQGRRYKLGILDNIVIMKNAAHACHNPSSLEVAIVHVTMSTDQPQRERVNRFYSKRSMPDDAPGVVGSEHLTRFATAPRYEAGPNTEFIDFFNGNLIPGIPMSGGYGRFIKGGRLPAHLHDFDESICIIEGDATCIVEGRYYSLSNQATALQPRGRIHYFINQHEEPMAMLWVYAGSLPQRMELDDVCCTSEGNPWSS